MLALWLEVRLSKQDIAELYLNRVYFGGGAYGIEAASHRYFGKSARSLTVAEAAVLAGLLKAPSRYSPANSPVLARARSQVVLKRMLDAGYITAADETAMVRRPVRFARHANEREAGAQYAVEFVLDRLPPVIGPNTGELVVHTTIDAGLQRAAQAAVEQILATEGRASGAQQAAVAVIDTEGRIRALVGGRSYAESQYDRAVKARRQPGSAFKPLVYLAALERGSTPDTMVVDAPITVAGWSPRNDSGTYQGLITLRTALAQSVNSVAVRLQQEVGTSRVIALAQRLGITSELRPSPSIALGTSEVSVLELTGAYGVLANGGLSVTPHAIRACARARALPSIPVPPPRRACWCRRSTPARSATCCIPRSCRGRGAGRCCRGIRPPARPGRRRNSATPGSSAIRLSSWPACGSATMTASP